MTAADMTSDEETGKMGRIKIPPGFSVDQVI